METYRQARKGNLEEPSMQLKFNIIIPRLPLITTLWAAC